MRKRVGMIRGSSDGEKGQHSTESVCALVGGGELWLLVHLKSANVKLTPDNVCM